MLKDHISLTFHSNNGEEKADFAITKRSFRRYWNQLPRCQKNLIIIAVFSAFLTLLFYLPGNEIILKDTKRLDHIEISSFQENNLVGSSYRNVNNFPKIIKPPKTNLDYLGYIEHNALNYIDNTDKNSAVFDSPNVQKSIVETSENLRYSFKGPKNNRQNAVVEAFKHSWKGYKEFAWGHDYLLPISKGYSDWFELGLTLVDSLDTMLIMNLQNEFEEARDWVKNQLVFNVDRDVNLFEVTIRVLGGLLSAYHLSGDTMFLKKSYDLGLRLLPCFNSKSGIPYSDVNLKTKNAHSPKWSLDSSTSEVTTLQLEFRDLSRSLSQPIFEQVSSRVNKIIHYSPKLDGLVRIFINANTGNFQNFSTISLGARGDSYYEYLLKQWIQTGMKDGDFLIEDYKTAIDGVNHWLVRKTPREHLTYIGELLSDRKFRPKMDHLTCYLPGTLLLGYEYLKIESHLKLAEELLETCYQTYMKQETKLAPEITHFQIGDEGGNDIYVKSNDAHNLLRPEFIESLYYFYALTGNQIYQDMGWTIFQAFENYTKVNHGYTAIGNVKNKFNTLPRDKMESFWLGETLKYFYLLFSDDPNEIDLKKFVFNTEAHPLPVRDG